MDLEAETSHSWKAAWDTGMMGVGHGLFGDSERSMGMVDGAWLERSSRISPRRWRESQRRIARRRRYERGLLETVEFIAIAPMTYSCYGRILIVYHLVAESR